MIDFTREFLWRVLCLTRSIILKKLLLLKMPTKKVLNPVLKTYCVKFIIFIPELLLHLWISAQVEVSSIQKEKKKHFLNRKHIGRRNITKKLNISMKLLIYFQWTTYVKLRNIERYTKMVIWDQVLSGFQLKRLPNL